MSENSYSNTELRGLRIGMIVQGDFPPDIRISKEARTLGERGAVIHLFANNKSGTGEKEEIVEGIHVHRLPPFNRLGRLGRGLKFPVFCNPLWVGKIFWGVRKYRIDVNHAHNLPLLPLVIMVGKLFALPVIYDMHEDYPEAFRIWKRRGIVSSIFRNYHVAKIVDSWCRKKADVLIAVAEEMKEVLVEDGIPSEKVVLVQNYVMPEIITRQPIQERIVERFRNSFNLLYLGAFSVERALDIPIRALGRIARDIPEVRLILAGTGRNINELKRLAGEEGVEERVVFTGWVPFELYRTYIALADVCLVPQPANRFIESGLPHKLTQFMCLGKPVVVSDARNLKRVVSDADCGRIFKSNNADDFARAVLSLKDKGVREKLGENGRKAVERTYNWEKASARLVELYRKLYSERRTSAPGRV